MTTERITSKRLPGGAVLLEKELEQPELVPDDLKLENIEPVRPRTIVCSECHKKGVRREAVAVLTPTPHGLALLPVEAAPDGGEFMSLCAPHAVRAKKQIRKRVRKMKRYATNLYTHREQHVS